LKPFCTFSWSREGHSSKHCFRAKPSDGDVANGGLLAARGRSRRSSGRQVGARQSGLFEGPTGGRERRGHVNDVAGGRDLFHDLLHPGRACNCKTSLLPPCAWRLADGVARIQDVDAPNGVRVFRSVKHATLLFCLGLVDRSAATHCWYRKDGVLIGRTRPGLSWGGQDMTPFANLAPQRTAADSTKNKKT